MNKNTPYKLLTLLGVLCLLNMLFFSRISWGNVNIRVISAVTGLEWPRVFQEVKVPRFHDNGTGWW